MTALCADCGTGVAGRRDRLSADERVVAIKGIELLAKAFPKCFYVNEKARKPLKVGVSNDIAARFPPGKMPKALGMALAYYTKSPRYLKKLVLGAARIGLDGAPAGTVTGDQEQQARLLLAGQQERRKKRLAREAEQATQSFDNQTGDPA